MREQTFDYHPVLRLHKVTKREGTYYTNVKQRECTMNKNRWMLEIEKKRKRNKYNRRCDTESNNTNNILKFLDLQEKKGKGKFRGK